MTERERDIPALMVEGLSNPEFTEGVVVSRSTARFLVSSVLSKLAVSSRTQVATLALRNKLI